LKDSSEEIEHPPRRVGSLRLATYQRVGRVCTIETLHRIFEEFRNARKSVDQAENAERAKGK